MWRWQELRVTRPPLLQTVRCSESIRAARTFRLLCGIRSMGGPTERHQQTYPNRTGRDILSPVYVCRRVCLCVYFGLGGLCLLKVQFNCVRHCCVFILWYKSTHLNGTLWTPCDLCVWVCGSVFTSSAKGQSISRANTSLHYGQSVCLCTARLMGTLTF